MSVRILLFLFFINSLSIYFYFSSPHKTPSFPENRRPLGQFDADHAKPWPALPSYLPWTHHQAPLDSCEAYFGNGYSQTLHLLKPVAAGSGWFRCLFSETLQSSICEGGRVRMAPDRIRMSRGGERLEDVVGRDDDEELPEFEDGAFEVDGGGLGFSKKKKKLFSEEFLDDYVPEGEVERHTMRALLGSIQVVQTKEFKCDEWVEEPTLLVTRFEYANLFHTFTDWYSSYVASRVTGLPKRPRLVFVDGHCTTQLEETWNTLFSGVRYTKDFRGPVCFRHAILSPLGYETAFFKGLTEEIDCVGASAHDPWQTSDDQKTARLSEFGEMIRASFGLPVDDTHLVQKKNTSGLNVLFVRREDYVAHPRHGGKVESRLTNEKEVFDSLKSWAPNHLECKVNLIDGLLAHMPMKEQVLAIQNASVIIGAHGAGLTHIVSATPNTVILEIISVDFKRPHFEYIARWKGLEYHAINLEESYADSLEVVDKLKRIMKSLGC